MIINERSKRRGITGVILGRPGVGKTSLLKTLDLETTLFIDIEGGDLSVRDLNLTTLRPESWSDCQELASLFGGPSKALPASEVYSTDHYNTCFNKFKEMADFNKYDTLFIDSVTAASRLSFEHARFNPNNPRIKSDPRVVYGEHAQQMISWLLRLQRTPFKNVWLTGVLDQKRDELNRPFYTPQLEGNKTALELPAIVDEVIIMAVIEHGDKLARAFVCSPENEWGYPAKDRSGKLNPLEAPDLGKLMLKINAINLKEKD